ncbi:hypothetical protein WJX75_002144 [Coccomyxa subellipsoidea]|uniref:Uncharacterized protein n=1 Tax=Coccomyxa subellipsoidea TaxID=248742 RepID=A0ABR2YU54_9CHLO
MQLSDTEMPHGTDRQQLLAGLEQLRKVHEIQREILDTYQDLEISLKELQGQASPLLTHVSVGADIMMQAKIPDTSRVFVDVGLGFKVECSIEDGLRIAQLRKAAAQEHMNFCAMQAVTIRAAL